MWNARVLLKFLFVCSVFSHSLTMSVPERPSFGAANRSGDNILYNQMRNRLTKEIRVAKINYS